MVSELEIFYAAEVYAPIFQLFGDQKNRCERVEELGISLRSQNWNPPPFLARASWSRSLTRKVHVMRLEERPIMPSYLKAQLRMTIYNQLDESAECTTRAARMVILVRSYQKVFGGKALYGSFWTSLLLIIASAHTPNNLKLSKLQFPRAQTCALLL